MNVDLNKIRYVEGADGTRFAVTSHWEGDVLRLVPEADSLPMTLVSGNVSLLDEEGNLLLSMGNQHFTPPLSSLTFNFDPDS